MTKEISRVRKTSEAITASNDDTQRLLAAAQRMVAEITRIGSPKADIADRHDWLETMINHVPDCIYAKDVNGRFLMANQATVAENGFSSMSEIVGKTDFDLHPLEAAQGFFDVERRVMETGEPMFDIEELAVIDKGSERWLATSKVPLRNKAGVTIGTVGVSRDITEQKRVERLLLGQARLLEKIAKSVPLQEFFSELLALIESHLPGIIGSVLLLSEDGKHLLTGAAPGLDQSYSAAIHGVEIGPKVGSCGTAAWRGEAVLVSDILSDPLWEDYAELVRPFGYRSCWSMPIRSYQGQVLGTFALYSHTVGTPNEEQRELISMAAHLAGIAIERQKTEERIHFMAHHDALTGLPNRVLFDERVAQALQKARRDNQWVALAFLDLDNFKLINDSLGHKAGDELLRVVARRMLACVRKTDMVVRVGGDEFILLLTDLPPENGIIVPRLEEIRRAIAAPLTLSGRSLQVSCSMGVVGFPEHGSTPDELLANADAAMYRAKELGRNNLQIFDAEMAATAHEKLRRYEELREAVIRNEFMLHYQPQMNLKTGRIFAAESLLRWAHPERGIVPPGEFIPLAEETGLIVDIGDWTLNAACRQNKAWQDAGLPPIVISVNVSARQFRERDWVCRVATALKESGLEARYLELELTESLIMQDVVQAVKTMHELEALGVQLAIDDFGTGYSSLSALKRFPVKRLKIDRSFVMDIPSDEDDKAITSAIISLAQELGMQVIAEGVETEAQVNFLRDNGCNEIQGYFFSRPVPADNLAALLAGMVAD